MSTTPPITSKKIETTPPPSPAPSSAPAKVSATPPAIEATPPKKVDSVGAKAEGTFQAPGAGLGDAAPAGTSSAGTPFKGTIGAKGVGYTFPGATSAPPPKAPANVGGAKDPLLQPKNAAEFYLDAKKPQPKSVEQLEHDKCVESYAKDGAKVGKGVGFGLGKLAGPLGKPVSWATEKSFEAMGRADGEKMCPKPEVKTFAGKPVEDTVCDYSAEEKEQKALLDYGKKLEAEKKGAAKKPASPAAVAAEKKAEAKKEAPLSTPKPPPAYFTPAHPPAAKSTTP